jgi:C4-dicarboxylate-specific signal transduction histidine kinase
MAWPWLGLAVLALGLGGIVRALRADGNRIARHDAHLKRVVERKVSERTAKLHDDIYQYRSLIENLDAVAFELDARDGTLVYIAPQVARLLECPLEELTLERIMASIHVDDRAIAAAALLTGQLGGPVDVRQITAKGRVIHTRTFYSAPDARLRVRGLTLDITREKQMETKLRQAQKLESVGRLSAGIAHEINSPIQYIADSIDFVRESLADIAITDDYLRENIPSALVRAGDGVERIAAIIRSMRAFEHKPSMTAVDVNQVVESTLTVTANEHRYVADIITDLGEVPPVWCHAGDLQHVLVTIVVNAAEALADAEDVLARRGQITVTTRSDNEQVVITIADTGPGIPEHLRAHIFEPFFTTKGVGKGVGQDLAVAHALIVERYHGSLVFESEVGHGTAFMVRLPAHAENSRAAA